MAETFIMHKEWLENISGLPIDQQDKILAEVVRYGTGIKLEHDDDPIVQAFVNMVKGRIDYSIEKYNNKLEMSKAAGRKKVFNDEQIYELAQKGMTAQEIAQEIGCSKSTVDKSKGWKNRHREEFIF